MATQTFDELTYRGQVGRLRALGRVVLPRFGLSPRAPLRLLHHGENSVFRTRDRRGRVYALRIHRTGYQSPATIRSEMMWLGGLKRDTSLCVPEPVAGKDGSFLQEAEHPGVPEARTCVLLRWVPGRFGHGLRGPAYYRRLGDLAGQLHAHGRLWERPAAFRRRAWTGDVLLGKGAGFGDPLATKGVRKGDRVLFREAMARAQEEMQALGKGKRTWGLVHADLHAGNVLTEDGVMGAIDFDDCGLGWYAYEFAVALGGPFERSAYLKRLDSLLETYTQHMDVDPRTIEAQECFVVTRRLSMVGWIGSRSDNPRLAAYAPVYVGLARESAKAWMA